MAAGSSGQWHPGRSGDGGLRAGRLCDHSLCDGTSVAYPNVPCDRITSGISTKRTRRFSAIHIDYVQAPGFSNFLHLSGLVCSDHTAQISGQICCSPTVLPRHFFGVSRFALSDTAHGWPRRTPCPHLYRCRHRHGADGIPWRSSPFIYRFRKQRCSRAYPALCDLLHIGVCRAMVKTRPRLTQRALITHRAGALPERSASSRKATRSG